MSLNLLNLIVRRALNNEALIKAYGADREAILKSVGQQGQFFYKLFPAQVEQGEKKRATFDWIVSRCADGRAKTAPREVIHLLNSLREKEVERIERGGLMADETLFDRGVFKAALAAVSNTRLSGTIYAEYDDLKTYIAKLEGQKTEQTFESLRSTWGVSVFDAERLVQKLVDIGFFQKKSSREEDTYWVPFLYRDALRMSQGLAED